MPTNRRPRRLAAALLASSAALVATAVPAAACGGLVGENGSIQLTKTATLAAYACHLPGHVAYGMEGTIQVIP